MSEPLDCDVVIVGAGIAGALMAWKLGSQGVKVVVLESGPANPGLAGRQEFVDMFKAVGTPYPLHPPALKPGDFDPSNYYVEEPEPRPVQGPVVASPTDSSKPGYDPFGNYNIINEQVAAGDWFQSNYERQAGGTTWHWLGTSLRLLPHDFSLESTYHPSSNGLQAYDWPIGYDDLESWYGEAEQTLGVSGPDTGEDYFNAYRTNNYPMPGIPPSYLDQQVVAAVQGKKFNDGWTKESYPLLVSPTPQARNSTPGYGGRAQCQGSSSCIPICPIQAKYDATQHVELASQMSNVEFRYQSVACQVLVDTMNAALPINGIQYKTWSGNEKNPTVTPGTVTGKIYVLASHAVENAKLLLLSPYGNMMTVANSSDQVGRNLADHPVSLVYALADNPVYGYRGPLSTSGVESLRDGDFRTYRGAFRMEIGNDGWSWPTNDPYTTPQEFVADGLYGTALAQAVANQLSRQLRIGCLCEQIPNPKFRVQLSDRLDVMGIPMPELTYGIDPYGQHALSAAVAASIQIFKGMIGNPIIQFNYEGPNGLTIDQSRSDPVPKGQQPNIFVREGWAGAGHIMGTHRMGMEAKSSVVDGTLKTHDHPNLYLLGSGNWPSYATGNPTLTIAALTLRAADTIKTQLTQMS